MKPEKESSPEEKPYRILSLRQGGVLEVTFDFNNVILKHKRIGAFVPDPLIFNVYQGAFKTETLHSLKITRDEIRELLELLVWADSSVEIAQADIDKYITNKFPHELASWQKATIADMIQRGMDAQEE